MKLHIHHHFEGRCEIMRRLDTLEDKTDLILNNQETIMADINDLKPALDAIDVKVAAVKTDVDNLIAKLSAVPPAGLTPEQQTAINDAVAHAQNIAASLGAIDTTANPPAA